MFKASELVKFAKTMVGQPYWYGTCVYKCTHGVLDSKTKQYPTHYTSSRKNRYNKDISDKKVCCDCIGLIKGFFWTNGGKGVSEAFGTSKEIVNRYAANNMPDKSADGMLQWLKKLGCENGKISTLPNVPGILLFSKGHVGVYVGSGKAVEARGFNYGVVETQVSKRNWTEWAKLPASLIEYDVEGSFTPVFYLGDRTLKKVAPLMKGNDVKCLQIALNTMGFDCGTSDGEFGTNTEKGVKRFQKTVGITVDGVVGSETLKYMRDRSDAIVTTLNAILGGK